MSENEFDIGYKWKSEQLEMENQSLILENNHLHLEIGTLHKPIDNLSKVLMNWFPPHKNENPRHWKMGSRLTLLSFAILANFSSEWIFPKNHLKNFRRNGRNDKNFSKFSVLKRNNSLLQTRMFSRALRGGELCALHFCIFSLALNSHKIRSLEKSSCFFRWILWKWNWIFGFEFVEKSLLFRWIW